ncbi:hypothetical protein GCM10009529_22720 [Micropruina glycogenica]
MVAVVVVVGAGLAVVLVAVSGALTAGALQPTSTRHAHTTAGLRFTPRRYPGLDRLDQRERPLVR